MPIHSRAGCRRSPCAVAAGERLRRPAGRTVFKRCAACHSDQSDVNKLGPSLFGVVGRPIASVARFKFSNALTNLKTTWTPELLDKFVTQPQSVAKGTKMVFGGLPNAADRRNLIAYLATLK